ncbi:MAG: KdsC family phosphatase [Vicinamibacterales bacterium]
MSCDAAELRERASRIRLILFDVDGVLTDGDIILNADGSESKRFSIRDGTGIVWAHRAGLKTGVLSGRSSAATALRAAQLGMAVIRQDVSAKQDVYAEIRRQCGLTDAEVAYMGDDVMDLPVLRQAGLSAAPADAAEQVRRRVHWVSSAAGGRGAARELVELVLDAQGLLKQIVAAYAGE